MTYQKFLDHVVVDLSPRLPLEADIRTETIKKNNGFSPVALIISDPDTNVFPTIYLDEYYERAKKGEDVKVLCDEIFCKYLKYKVDCKLDMSFLSDFEAVKDMVVFRLVNMAKNRELLMEIPHVPFMDLAIIFCLSLKTDESLSASTIIRNEHLKSWNTDSQVLHQLAKRNTKRLLGCSIKSLPDFLNDMAGQIVIDNLDPSKLMYILTNELRTHGASCLLYEGILKDFSHRFVRDVYILPSSIHEVMLLADDGTMDMEELSALVREINETQLAPEEILSDHVYKYIRKDDLIVF